MVAPVAVAAGSAAYNSANNEGGLLNQLIKIILIALVIGLVIFLVATVFLTITYWEEIGVFFTTGFIGWLNPFDSPDGDYDPVGAATDAAGDAVSGAVSGVTGPINGQIRTGFSIFTLPIRYLWNRL